MCPFCLAYSQIVRVQIPHYNTACSFDVIAAIKITFIIVSYILFVNCRDYIKFFCSILNFYRRLVVTSFHLFWQT